jgi:hypothetical protein
MAMMQSPEWIATARVLRRTGFGASGAAVDAAVRVGASGYVAAMLAADPVTEPGARATPAPAFAPIAPLDKAASRTERQQHNQQMRAQLSQLTAWWSAA